ncbi:MAG: stage V sporulation protein S [Nanoarchaeota archaeon]
MEKILLKVAGDTAVGKLAGSISKNLDEDKFVEVIAIGASANNQAVKAIATAEGHAGSKGKSLNIKIGFTSTDVRSGAALENRTAILFRIKYND